MVRVRWTKYKDRPMATFLSASLNLAGMFIFIGGAAFILGIAYGNITGIIIGGIVLAGIIFYIIKVSKYLKSVEEEIVIQHAGKEIERRRQIEERIKNEAAELKQIYPEFDFEVETKNPVFGAWIKQGWSIREAYEKTHGIGAAL